MAFASRAVCLLLVSLALCQAASAAESAATVQIVATFGKVTTMSSDLDNVAKSLNIITAVTDGYKIGAGFGQIIAVVGDAANMLSNMQGSLSADDSNTVVGVLTTFVHVHQALLQTVIGKHGLLTLIPFFEPIRQALVDLEATIDAFAFALIAVIEPAAAAAQAQFSALDGTCNVAIATYSEPV